MTTAPAEGRDPEFRGGVGVVGCSTKPRSSSRTSSHPLCFPCKSVQIESRRADLRTAYPCSRYEFACTRSSPYWCVRKLRLAMGFSTLLARLLVHCVLVCTSPVAVRVAVHGLLAIRAR